MIITVKEILEATGGTLLCGDADAQIKHIQLDSRTMEGDDLFVPIIGEKTDGHKYIDGAFALGAVATLTCEHDAANDTAHAFIRVDDTVEALQKIGSYLRDRFDIPFVGITGSVGKTTTREMIACALSAGMKCTATKGNSNSQVGVPVTLSLLDETADIAVMELGMSEPGEMHKIASIAKVNTAVITNIGVSHIENLGSQRAIMDEKLHITDFFDGDGTLIINGDDPLLLSKLDEYKCKVITYGFDPHNDYCAEKISRDGNETSFVMHSVLADVPVRLRIPGDHIVMNSLAAFAVCDHFGVDFNAAAKALSDFVNIDRRLQIQELDGFTLIDDSYNASPDSVRAALKVLASTKTQGKHYAVLADMLELGPDSPRFHSELGTFAAELSIDKLFAIGELSRNTAEAAARKGLESESFLANEDAFAALKAQLRPGDVVLLKGSNGMHLNEIAQGLKEIKLEVR